MPSPRCATDRRYQTYALRLGSIVSDIRLRMRDGSPPTLRNICLVFRQDERFAASVSQALVGKFAETALGVASHQPFRSRDASRLPSFLTGGARGSSSSAPASSGLHQFIFCGIPCAWHCRVQSGTRGGPWLGPGKVLRSCSSVLANLNVPHFQVSHQLHGNKPARTSSFSAWEDCSPSRVIERQPSGLGRHACTFLPLSWADLFPG